MKARHTLAITGTPIQNDRNELGLLYLFLNDAPSFNKIIDIDNTNEKNIFFKNGIDRCCDDSALFFHFEQKENFKRRPVILSLPINEALYRFLHSKLAGHSKKQLMYLSHPASIYFSNSRNKKLPYCAKAEAVAIILKSMLNDEKAIVFSLFIDILHVYSDLLRDIGFPAIIITGADKGEKMEEKLALFKSSSHFRVLLATMQKASEGFNFDFATHVIILEFWWNPQKIFQAMSRIDRKTQTRNIFIYLLCYNIRGEMIREEAIYFDKMEKKVKDAQAVYKRIAEKNDLTADNRKNQSRDLPKKNIFSDESLFPYELAEFLAGFHQTEKLPENEINERYGSPIYETRNSMMTQFQDFSYSFSILCQYPWRIIAPDVSDPLLQYFHEKLKGKTGKKINDDILKHKWSRQFDPYYPFVFIGEPIKIIIYNYNYYFRYVIGKRKDGKYDLLFLQDCKENEFVDLFFNLRNIGIENIDSVILSIDTPNIIDNINNILKNYFPDATCHWCIINFFKYFTDLVGLGIPPPFIYHFEGIFRFDSIHNAYDHYKEVQTSFGDFVKKMDRHLDLISHIYRYSLNERMVIGSTNITSYINMITRVFLGNKPLDAINALAEIERISRIVLENGAELMPIWDYLAMPVESK
jgi:hypothetical protein